MTIQVSVIMPTFNQGSLLKEAVDSVLSQAGPSLELIVINNFSTDNTEQVLSSYQDTRLRVAKFANGGSIAAARNHGASLACGEHLAFLDSDDIWLPGKLQASILLLERGYDLVCSPVKLYLNSVYLRDSRTIDPKHFSYNTMLLMGNCIVTSSVVMKSKIFRDYGGFCVEQAVVTAEDYDLWLRLARANIRMAFLPEAYAVYRLHAGNNSAKLNHHLAAVREVIERHFRSASMAGQIFTSREKGSRRALMYYSIGKQLGLVDGLSKQVIGYFLKSIAHDLLFWKSYLAILLLLPPFGIPAVNRWFIATYNMMRRLQHEAIL